MILNITSLTSVLNATDAVSEREIYTGFMGSMLIYNFPSGVFVYAIDFDWLVGLSQTERYIVYWSIFVVIGYLQWFIVVPKAYKKLFAKKYNDSSSLT